MHAITSIASQPALRRMRRRSSSVRQPGPGRPRNLARSGTPSPRSAGQITVILVVALTPALDVTHHVRGVDWAGVNRPAVIQARAGGKGLNVARTLRAIGAEVQVIGLAGGF